MTPRWNGDFSSKLASCLATLVRVLHGRKGDSAAELASCLATLVKSRPGWIFLVGRWVVFYTFYCCTQFTTPSVSLRLFSVNEHFSTKLASCLVTLIGVFPGRKGDYATKLASYLATLVKSHLVVKCFLSDDELYSDCLVRSLIVHLVLHASIIFVLIDSCPYTDCCLSSYQGLGVLPTPVFILGYAWTITLLASYLWWYGSFKYVSPT